MLVPQVQYQVATSASISKMKQTGECLLNYQRLGTQCSRLQQLLVYNMATITTIQESDQITNSRTDINTNFANLNDDKIETSVLDTDTALTANSDAKIATQKAVKAYVDTGGNMNASETTKGIVEEATDAEVTAGTATGGTGAKLFVSPAKLATYGVSKTAEVQVYVANDTWTKPTGAKVVEVVCVG